MSNLSSNVTPTVQGAVTAGNVAVFTADKQLVDGGSPAGTGINQLTGDVTAGPGSGSQAATLANTAVTPGSYTNADITVDSKGRITAAANGSSGSGTVTNTGTLTSGKLIQGNGGVDVTVNATTATVTKLTSGTPSAATDGTDYLSPATGMTRIEQQTPTGTAVTFSSLGTFTDLLIQYSARGDAVATSAALNMTFNGDTGSNYDREASLFTSNVPGCTESVGGTSAFVGSIAAASAPSSVPGVGELTIFDYRGTTFHKAGIAHNHYKLANSTTNVVLRSSGFSWRSAAAITSVTITLSAGNFVAGSKFTLYGLP